MNVDPAWLEDVMGYLPWEHAARLSAHFEPKWKTRQRRLALRAEAVRNALQTLYPGWKLTVATTALAREYGRYLASGWKLERDRIQVPDELRHNLLWRLAKLADGAELSASSIYSDFQKTAGDPETSAVSHSGHEEPVFRTPD